MDRVQRGDPWTGSTGLVHGPGVHVLYTSLEMSVGERLRKNRAIVIIVEVVWPPENVDES